jgi:ABC-type transporter Mla MlaB component
MLRITTHEEAKAVTLRLEGSVAGPVLAEFYRTWHALAASLGSRKLSVDLCGVTFVDEAGRRLLAEIHNTTAAQFLADTPFTKYFAEQASRGTSRSEN